VSTDPHPASEDLAATGALAMAAQLADGSRTAASLTHDLLARVAAVDVPLGVRAVLAVAGDAEQQAVACDRRRTGGVPVGPLHGVPVLVKDNVETAGLPGTAGSLALVDRPVRGDAPLVARMRAAGMVVIGATNLSEWANIRSSRSTSGWSAVGGLTTNPWARDRSAGGSSSGSGAALAAGYAPLAVGTETDGSITCPASFTGVVGLKPTVGLVPTSGVVPISASQDSPGPMGRSVADVAALLDVLAGGGGHLDAVAAAGGAVRGLRLGVVPAWLSDHADTDDLFADVLAALGAAGAELVDVTLPAAGEQVGADEEVVLLAELADDLGAYLAGRGGAGPASLAALVAFNEAHAATELAYFGQDLLEKAVASGGRAGPDYAAARRRGLDWALGCLRAALDGPDAPVALLGPAMAPACKTDLVLGDAIHGGEVTTTPSLAGWPILTVPMGLAGGLPVGLSLVGRPHEEAALLAAGDAVHRLCAPELLRPAWATTS